MKFSITAIPEDARRGARSKYGEIVAAVREAPDGQAVCVECESPKERARVFQSVRATFRPERGGDPTKRLRSSARGDKLYLWAAPAEPQTPTVATRFVKSA